MVSVVKVLTILNSQQVLTKISGFDLPINIAYTISKNLKAVEDVLKIFDDKRKKIFDKYSDESDESEAKILDEHKAKYADEVNALADQEVDAELTRIKASDLEGCKLSVQDIKSADWLIKF